MLFGQDRGGCQDGGLRPAGVDHRRSERRNHGLPGADVALQQAVHRLAGFQVGADVGQGALLGGGQGEGQRRQAGLQPVIADFEDTTGRRLPVALLTFRTHLQEEEFVEGQPLASRAQFLLRIREMRLQERHPKVGQVGRLSDGFGQVIGQLGRPVSDDLFHQLAQPFLGNVGRQRVDRHDTVGVQVLGFDRLPVRAVHHEPAEVLLEPGPKRKWHPRPSAG